MKPEQEMGLAVALCPVGSRCPTGTLALRGRLRNAKFELE